MIDERKWSERKSISAPPPNGADAAYICTEPRRARQLRIYNHKKANNIIYLFADFRASA